jgi:hypothetical protein
MTSFTLYETLNTEIPKKDLTSTQKTKLIDIISKLDPNGMELIYALIKRHSTSDKSCENLYKHSRKNTRNANCDMSWNLTDLPIHLRQILYKFVCLEEQRITEAEARINTQVKMKNKIITSTKNENDKTNTEL